jgi:Immunity protein Imm1
VAKTLTYSGPTGPETGDYPLEHLIERIRDGGSGHWNRGAGGGILYYGPVHEDRTLSIYFVPGEGFHLVFATGDTEPLAASLPAAPPGEKYRSIDVGGDPVAISRRQCLAPERAEAVVRHFAEHGTMTPEVEWLPQE